MGAAGTDFEKRRAETMLDPQVQQAYMTAQMAKAFETVASAPEKSAPPKAAENKEVHHVQPITPAEQPQMRVSTSFHEPSYSNITARRQTYEEVAAYSDPSHGDSGGSSGDKFDRAAEKLQNNLDNWQNKSEHLTNKLQKVEMKSQVHTEKDLKNFHSFTFYSDENGKVGVQHNVDRVTKSEHEYKKGRGILHKLDARFSGENMGFVYVGKSQTGKGLELKSKDMPEPLRKARHFAYKGALKAESAALYTKDAFQHVIGDKAVNLAVNKARNEIYKAGQENAGMKALTVTAGTAYSAAMGLKRWSGSRKEYLQQSKGIKLENKQVRLKNKIEKLELKSAAAKETALTKALIAGAKEGGLDINISRAEKKKAWRQVYNGSKGDGYLRSAKNIGKEEKWTNKHSGEPPLEKKSATKIDKSIDKLDKKEFKNAKKLYKTKVVKQEYVNDLTGEKLVRRERVADTSRKKRPKVKRPDSLAYMAVAGGVKKLGRKAMSEMATDDNAGASVLGQALQFTASEMARSKQQLARQSKLKFEKKQSAAKLKMESARSEKLMLEKERAAGKTEPPSKKAKKENQKQARKKSSQKKRNAEAFKERAKKAAKKAKEKAVSAAKEFFVSKAKYVAIAGAGAIILMLLPVMLVGMVGGGGGGGMMSGVAGVAAYTSERDGLIKFNDDFNDLLWQWQDGINNKMKSLKSGDTEEWELVLNGCSGGPISSCEHVTGSDYVTDPENVYTVIKTLYGGEKCGFSDYDITCLYAYFTVKYRDKPWASVSAELGKFLDENFVLDSRDGDTVVDLNYSHTLDQHVTMDCQKVKNPPATDGDGKPVNTGYHYEHHGHPEPHNVDVVKRIKYYYLYPKDGKINTIQEYIREEVKKIGEVKEDGRTEGELHYEFLLESLGLHQVINFPVLNESGEYVDWSSLSGEADGKQFGTLTELYDLNEGTDHPADYAYQQRNESVDYVVIPYSGERLECVAGGKGVIKSKTSKSVTIEYPDDNLILTYTCNDGTIRTMTTLSVGSAVEDGTHLFYSDASGGNDPSVKITAHDTELDKDINPLLVIQSKIH